jgi:hypothetical protein
VTIKTFLHIVHIYCSNHVTRIVSQHRRNGGDKNQYMQNGICIQIGIGNMRKAASRNHEMEASRFIAYNKLGLLVFLGRRSGKHPFLCQCNACNKLSRTPLLCIHSLRGAAAKQLKLERRCVRPHPAVTPKPSSSNSPSQEPEVTPPAAKALAVGPARLCPR